MLYIRITLVNRGTFWPILILALRSSPRLCQSGQIHEKTEGLFHVLATFEVVNPNLTKLSNRSMHIFFSFEINFEKLKPKIPELDGNCLNGSKSVPFMQLPSNSSKKVASLLLIRVWTTGRSKTLVTRSLTDLFVLQRGWAAPEDWGVDGVNTPGRKGAARETKSTEGWVESTIAYLGQR